MKVLVDASSMIRRPTGVGQYTRSLLGNAAKLDQKDSYTLVAFLFLFKRVYAEPLAEYPNVKYRYIRYLPGRAYNLLLMMGLAPAIDLLLGQSFDWVIYPNFVRFPLLSKKSKTITLVHDLGYLLYPQYVERPRFQKFLYREVPKSLHSSTWVATISESTKRDIIKHYRIDPTRIRVITPAVDHNVYKQANKANIDRVKNKYHIKGDYLLFLGSLDPRKNVAGVVKAFRQLDPEISRLYRLVLAGGRGNWDYPELSSETAALGSERLTITGYVDEADKPALYSGAKLLLYPSHYEGWGMQILEAMACGLPVVTARNSSLTEAGGDAAAYIDDSSDCAALAKEITRLLSDPALLASMSAKGLTHAAKFTWERSAQALLSLMEE